MRYSPARSSRCGHRTSCSLLVCMSSKRTRGSRVSTAAELQVWSQELRVPVEVQRLSSPSTTTVTAGYSADSGEGPTCLMSRPNSRGSFRPLFPATCSYPVLGLALLVTQRNRSDVRNLNPEPFSSLKLHCHRRPTHLFYAKACLT